MQHRERFRLPILALFLTPVLLWGQPPSGPAPVRVATVEEVQAPATLTVVGEIEPIRRSVVTSKEASTVIDFPFREGMFVDEGAVLALLETDLLDLSLKESTATRDALREELAELENGTRVEEIEAARAQLQGAEAQLGLALARRSRAEKLAQGNAASADEFDLAVAVAEGAKYAVDRYRADLKKLENGPRAEMIAGARARLASQEAVVDGLKKQIERHQVRAPFAGYVAVEQTEIGQWLKEGDPVIEILDLSSVDATLPVPSKEISKISLGSDVRIDTEFALDQLLVGKVVAILPEADRRSRLVTVKVRLANVMQEKQPILKAGMIARAHFAIGDAEPTLQIPKDALVLGTGPPLVYRVVEAKDKGAMTVEPISVMLGAARGESVQIKGALKAGDKVVTEGNERLKPGQGVQILAHPTS